MSEQTSNSESETEAIGEAFARTLDAGAIVFLTGGLGAGKTAFVRGMARGIGASPTDVSSPTFSLLQEYSGSALTLYHADLYRLSPKEVDDLGLADISAEGILAVEWPDRWSAIPHSAIQIKIEKTGDSSRAITVKA